MDEWTTGLIQPSLLLVNVDEQLFGYASSHNLRNNLVTFLVYYSEKYPKRQVSPRTQRAGSLQLFKCGHLPAA